MWDEWSRCWDVVLSGLVDMLIKWQTYGWRENVEEPRARTAATEAGVSRDFLYRTTDLRERIIDLRGKTVPTRAPTREAPRSDPLHHDTSSVVRTLTAKLTLERSTSRKRIAELEAALAAAHGQLLQLRRQNLRPPPGTA
jgi:hypothetical protein